MPWVIAGGGTSVTLTVVLSDVVSNRLTATWDNPGNASLFQVFLRDGGVSTYIEPETSNLSVEIPLSVSQVGRTVSVEVYSLDGCGSASVVVPASTVNPLTAYRIFGDNLSFSGQTTSALASFRSAVLNNDDHPIVEVSSVIASIADPPAKPSSITYFGGAATVVDETIPTPPDGGGTISGDNQKTPTLAFTESKVLGAGVAAGAWFEVQVTNGVGGIVPYTQNSLVVGSASTGSLAKHPSAYLAGGQDAYSTGDQKGVRFAAGTAIGIYQGPAMLIAKMGSRNGVPALLANCAFVGDSLCAQQLPNAWSNVEGWCYQSNKSLALAHSNIRLANFAQGGGRLSDIQHRLNAVMQYPEIYTRCQIAFRQVATANQTFNALSEAQAAWAIFLAQAETILTNTGVIVLPLMMSPAPSFAQGQASLDSYAWLAEQTDLMDGLRLDDVISLYTHMVADGAHVNEAGQTLQAAAAVSRLPGILTRHGVEVTTG